VVSRKERRRKIRGERKFRSILARRSAKMTEEQKKIATPVRRRNRSKDQ
jgi:hypothetical protein